ncbi:hypothetical protein [Roseovarius phycicola]|uniref:Tetratricopeptide repeat protein n=1 Tax=Roseovarius phycicola TaxID=3080976 RepID=A0ABZ2HHT2_9RHOB
MPSITLPQRRRSRTGQIFESTADLSDALVGEVPQASENSVQAEAISKTHKELLQQLARAATQGLLTAKTAFKDRTAMSDPGSSVSEEQTPDTLRKPDEMATDPNLADSLSVSAVTSMDRDFLEGLAAARTASFTSRCLDPDRVDVGSWVSGLSFAQQVGPLRAELTNEIDRPNQKIAERLVKSYLYFGFGLEALNVQHVMFSSHDDTEIYAALANIVDGQPMSETSVFQDQLTCNGPTALWAALSHAHLPTDLDINTNAILLSFSELPRHLRADLGPTLSRLFLDAGYLEQSAQVLRVLDRVPETKTPEEALAKAQYHVATGEDELAMSDFETAIVSDSRPSATALVEMVQAMLERGEKIPQDIAELVGAYAFERQSDDIGSALIRVHILALASSGNFTGAFEILETTSAIDDEVKKTIRSDLADILIASTQHFDLLRFALSGKLGDVQYLNPNTSFAIAQELKTSRFYDAALQFLNRSFPQNLQANARLLRAEIVLFQGNPRTAEAELLGLDGHDANVLRARAKSMLGNHEQAFDLYQSAGMTSDATREAWLAKDWDRLPEESGVFGVIAQVHVETEPHSNDGQLAQNNALVDTASGSRRAIETMLSAMPQPEDISQ